MVNKVILVHESFSSLLLVRIKHCSKKKGKQKKSQTNKTTPNPTQSKPLFPNER